MKKALLLTDGTIDLALMLNRWLETQTTPVDLTVVYPFALPPTGNNQPLNAATYGNAKETARESLNHWLNFLPQSWPGQLHTELFLGEPELVLNMYLLLRRYDYLLLGDGQEKMLNTYLKCQHQTSAQLGWLTPCAAPVLRLAHS